MSKLLDLINKKQNQINAQKNRLTTLKVKLGSNTYRLLPSWRGEGEAFWHDYGVHFVKGTDGKTKSVFTCLKATHGKDCPICNYLSQARGRVDDATGAILKDSEAGKRVLINVLEVNGDKPTTPQTLEVSMTTFSEILAQFELWGEKLVNMENGNNIIIKRSGQGINTSYTVMVDPNPTSIKNPEKVLENLVDIDKAVSYVDEDSKNRALDAINDVCGVLPAPSKPALDAIPMERPAISAPVVDVTDAEPVMESKPVATPDPMGAVAISDSELDDILADI